MIDHGIVAFAERAVLCRGFFHVKLGCLGNRSIDGIVYKEIRRPANESPRMSRWNRFAVPKNVAPACVRLARIAHLPTGGATVSRRSNFGTARDRISTDPDAADLFERRPGRNCVSHWRATSADRKDPQGEIRGEAIVREYLVEPPRSGCLCPRQTPQLAASDPTVSSR